MKGLANIPDRTLVGRTVQYLNIPYEQAANWQSYTLPHCTDYTFYIIVVSAKVDSDMEYQSSGTSVRDLHQYYAYSQKLCVYKF